MNKEEQYINEKELWKVVIKVADMEVRFSNLETCQTG